MDETELKKVCNEIYLKHKNALDFIYSHKSAEYELICSNFKDWLSAHNNTVIDKNSFWFSPEGAAWYIGFQSSYLNGLFGKVGNPEESLWKPGYFYCYQLVKYKNDSCCKLRIEFCYDRCLEENKKKIDVFFVTTGKKWEYKWGRKSYALNEYDTETLLNGNVAELMENIQAEEKKIQAEEEKIKNLYQAK